MEGSARPVSLAASRRRFARREFDSLIDEAMKDLAAVRAGDLAGAYDAHRAVNRAVMILMDHALEVA